MRVKYASLDLFIALTILSGFSTVSRSVGMGSDVSFLLYL